MGDNGELRDGSNSDPNYLSILNQPFSIELDSATLRDIARLRGNLPFALPSPITGGTLRGHLARANYGMVAGRRVIGVDFDADGPMRGPLPDHPEMTLRGKIRMTGVAYYDLRDALLLALNATLTITGNLQDRSTATPVKITYTRSFKAQAAAARQEADR
ncbi:MAG: hypothetical protein M3Y21_01315 [Candidatus Eremiobacteraeota bacterium]|nr:hypothetical protein [Candidatus Eremiobacteraeota bacterium]